MYLEYFQMIDHIDEIDVVEGVLKASSVVPKNSPVFEGHFPGMPLVPGVLLIETMAQASGFLTLAKTSFTRMPFLVAVKQGKLRTFVEPETALDVTAEIAHDGSGFSMTKASISSNGKKLCDAELTLRTMPFPDEKFAKMIADRARDLGMPTEHLGST